MHESNMTHSNITCSQIVFDRRGKVRLSPGFGHILRSKSETQSTLSQHNTLTGLLCEGTQNYRNKQNLLKDKFTLLIQHGKTAGLPQEESLLTSLSELKKQDLFDLGVVLTICATDGLDMVNEEYVAQLKKMNK
jgi:hypothetical protein